MSRRYIIYFFEKYDEKVFFRKLRIFTKKTQINSQRKAPDSKGLLRLVYDIKSSRIFWENQPCHTLKEFLFCILKNVYQERCVDELFKRIAFDSVVVFKHMIGDEKKHPTFVYNTKTITLEKYLELAQNSSEYYFEYLKYLDRYKNS